MRRGDIMNNKLGKLLKAATMPDEKYKRIIIAGKESSYIISSYGRVISTNYRMTKKPHILKDKIDENGYHSVCLYHNGIRNTYKVHRLVAEYFIENPDNKPEVNHIDGNKSNNAIWNLEWATRTENMQHAVRTGLHRALAGENHPESKYSNNDVRRVCELLSSGKYSVTEVSELTGMNRSSVSNIAFKKNHNNISKDYDFSKFYNCTDRQKYPERNWKYSPDQFHSVCKELVKNELTMKEIAKKTGVSYVMVKRVYHGNKKTDISSQYDFSHYSKIRSHKR